MFLSECRKLALSLSSNLGCLSSRLDLLKLERRTLRKDPRFRDLSGVILRRHLNLDLQDFAVSICKQSFALHRRHHGRQKSLDAASSIMGSGTPAETLTQAQKRQHPRPSRLLFNDHEQGTYSLKCRATQNQTILTSL